MSRSGSLTVHSKWAKTKAILRSGDVRSYVPDTRRMTAAALREMLSRYRMVYIKPNSGMFGNGVMRVERRSQNGKTLYSYQHDKKRREFRDFGTLFASIGRHKRKGAYLVQKGIPLLTYRGRRFDIRVMIQRNAKRAWEATGIIGRLSHPAKIVTNYHSGGTPMSIRTLLKPQLGVQRIAKLERTLAQVGRASATALSRVYPRINMVGADIGLDAGYKPWIIELNTSPDPYLFRHLPDKSTHRKVLRYARALGRIPKRKSK
ncbi:YheC/YheD family protein [Cohnella nanjingensis]|uniref:YheC/YheD family protein n=1 Tax=Cohnella nanjingensis TaxID=1387779 RepID=A0A7X0VF15_9BACL|nr:YheC/YheD family protein [Cohnella nanjingensis]MBB6671336.1 YheC/YheD family protein [Cohnella nanjingensis]